CTPTMAIDCVQPAFGMSFGQDECYGSDDAGIANPITFACCAQATVSFTATNCGPTRVVMINVLVDWNGDGDWNDNVRCDASGGVCAFEWALKNVPITLPSGCTPLTSPSFLTGRRAGNAWMRVTISDEAVPDDFPWNGSVSVPGQFLRGGETEDYPVTIVCTSDPCNGAYTDFGDAPEEVKAYPGVTGHFPTCTAPGIPGTIETVCAAISSLPGPTGYIKHEAAATDPNKFWLGS